MNQVQKTQKYYVLVGAHTQNGFSKSFSNKKEALKFGRLQGQDVATWVVERHPSGARILIETFEPGEF